MKRIKLFHLILGMLMISGCTPAVLFADSECNRAPGRADHAGIHRHERGADPRRLGERCGSRPAVQICDQLSTGNRVH